MTEGPELVEPGFFLRIRSDLLNPDVSRLIILGTTLDISPSQTGNIGVAVGDGLRTDGFTFEVSGSFGGSF